MSKAGDLSKQYMEFRERCGIKDPVMLGEIEEAYFEGYHQAEKDLELTWEDLKMLDDISDDVYAECDVEMFDEKEYYQEVLKRFKERKEILKKS